MDLQKLLSSITPDIYKNLKTISSSLSKSWQITNEIKIFENLDKKEESIIEDKNIEEVEEYAKRVKGHLNKCTLAHDQLTINMIIQSVFIIKDIQG